MKALRLAAALLLLVPTLALASSQVSGPATLAVGITNVTGGTADTVLKQDSSGKLADSLLTSDTNITLTSGDFIFGGGSFDYTLSAAGTTQATTFTLPDIGAAAATFATLEGAQTFSGAQTFLVSPKVSNTAPFIDMVDTDNSNALARFEGASGDIHLRVDQSNVQAGSEFFVSIDGVNIFKIDASGNVTQLSSIAPSSHGAFGVSPPSTGAVRADGAVNITAGNGLINAVASGAASNPGTNETRLYVREDIDQGAGTATADCALVARLSGGTEVLVQVLVEDGGCA